MAARSKENRLVSQVAQALAHLLDIEPGAVSVRPGGASDADLFITAVGETFVAQWSKSAGAAPVAAAAKKAAQCSKQLRKRVIPLVAVPFMGQAGQRACEEARVAWLDLSGNARIVAPGIRVIVDGRPNRFIGPGRPPNLFAPRSARVTRWLLMHPSESFIQRELARRTHITEGFVSRIVSRLEQDGYVTRDPNGTVRAKDPGLLLDAWREVYQFSKHTLIRGNVAARSGDALARFVGDTLAAAKIEHAATGLAAAWQMTQFAMFRVATFFLRTEPPPTLKDKLGFREEARGANLWLVMPNDDGVFHGADDHGGLRCVHPVQAYLDLKDHPERAAEAAERLRSELLSWKRHA
jgi:hypothetical protein